MEYIDTEKELVSARQWNVDDLLAVQADPTQLPALFLAAQGRNVQSAAGQWVSNFGAKRFNEIGCTLKRKREQRGVEEARKAFDEQFQKVPSDFMDQEI